jgi:thiamine biosynthesis lipoprotein
MNIRNKLKGRVICLFFMVAVLFSCNEENQTKKNKVSGNALGTTYHITYLGEEQDSVLQKIDSIVFAVNHGLSTYQENSFITAFNLNDGDIWQDPTEAKHFMNDMQHFVEMVSLSKRIANKTSNAFDPSSKLLFDEYTRAKKSGEYMKDEAVNYALLHKGMHKVQFDEQGIPYKLDSFVQLNFNAIAKGYLVDLVADYLTTKGVNNYMVEVGGEMRLKGKNAEGKLWQVGINVPLLEANPTDLFKVLELETIALATSGNYQNFYKVDDEVIGHTFDPRTGKPVLSDLKSVSIMHKNCAVADAYATACMVLGLEESKKLISADSSLAAYFIYDYGEELKGEFVE